MKTLTRSDIVTKRTATCACPECGIELSGATGWGGRGPEPGDPCVCIRCGHLMVFNEDLSVREPNDEEILEFAGARKILIGQKVADGVRKAHADVRKVPVPDRMKHLPRDPRGYPIFAMAYRDADGRAHFTINDERERLRLIAEDRCSICGGKLLRGRWFIGGEKSAFHPHGVYQDPAMHRECARYALHVCPYLAAPSYAKLIHGATLPANDPVKLVDQTALNSPSTVEEVRPAMFVAVHARGQRLRQAPAGCVIVPARPYIAVEYWQHGFQLARETGEAICRAAGLEPNGHLHRS